MRVSTVPERIKVVIQAKDGNPIEVEHALPGPWTFETFKFGGCVVLNASGQNWTSFPDKPGAVLVSGPEFATAIVDALNATLK